ncbi:hypothetical protein [uncultured Ruminococcus sp.]|uniref:hypothetical protein n=1 Tax=uncultured Ruminococcus sp. TaxID=165186 RepID=UPI002638A583|nr:hypothetical protein [uncultured Ruminococcus sp.]
MKIVLTDSYDVQLSAALLGYVGETNARPVTVEGLTVDGADRYVLTIDYGDGVVYDVDISGGTWTPTADILRAAQTVSCQISARKYDNGSYTLVKKSKIFSMRIGQALSDGVAPIPSPSVAADALDRMTALGGRITADVQTAVTAAETATTAADNAAKSATNAGVSADTATQAASRAETAQTVAETSATQAETAMQGADTARQQAVAAQNNAKISADIAAAAAQQTTADKTATAGYAETAKTAADSAVADRQAVADHAAKVAEDRTAAEAAAQTAQSIADSLPEDYTTAVGKIAENTAEIGRVKLTDEELQRRVDALYDMGQGITHRFETDSETAYQKTVPTGAKLMSVKSIGGHSEVIDGEIVSAGVTEVVEQGANLYYGTNMLKVGSDDYEYLTEGYWAKSIKLKPKTTYTIGFKALKESAIILLLNVKKQVNATGYLDFRQTTGAATYTTGENGYLYVGVTGAHSTSTDVVKRLAECKIIISESDAQIAYAPYHSNTYPIPESIRALPGYGWSAGTAKNYVDYENKQYHQCVGSVDLGTLNWIYGNLPFGWGDNQWFSAPIQSIKAIPANTQLANVLCKKYTTRCAYVADGNDFFRVDKSIGQHQGVARVTVLDTAYTDAATFKQAMRGVILYYELATPIVTDISTLIPDDFLRNIEVEAGGSVIFKNGNGDSYRIPVPSEEEYIVKLSEVGGTT